MCVLDRAGTVLLNQACANDWQVIRDTVARFGTTVRAAIEACSGSADLAEELVTRAGWLVDLAHPGYVARMKGNPDKTDFSDAKMLADLERVGYLPKVWHAPAEVRELRRLVRYRQQLVGERRNVKLRIGALLRDNRATAPEGVNPWTVAWVTWLTLAAELSEQTGEAQKKWSKRAPVRARRSRLGVRISRLPAQPIAQWPWSSVRMRRTLGEGI